MVGIALWDSGIPFVGDGGAVEPLGSNAALALKLINPLVCLSF